MKKTLSIVSVVLVLVFMMGCFVGCSQTVAANAIPAGTYKLVEMYEDGQDLTSYLSLIGEANLIVNDDNTAELTFDGSSTKLTIDPDAGTMTDASGSTAKYTLDGNKITFEQDDTKMVFEK